MTKLQLINGMETIINVLKEIEETEFTSCMTHETFGRLNDLFDTFEEEYDCGTYEQKKDSLIHLFPNVQDLAHISIWKPISHDNEKTTDTELPDCLKESLRLLGV